MKRRLVFFALRLLDYVVVISSLLVTYGLVWEYSTRQYLEGFAAAVVPAEATPEVKVEAILAWMRNGPSQQMSGAESQSGLLVQRDPRSSLNNAQLLRVCGTATNAFVNLADTADLRVRRLLLLDDKRTTKHVVAEVEINGQWVVVDPSMRLMFRDSAGRLLTKEDLQNPATLKEATRDIPHYAPNWTCESTVHVRLSKIPVLGRFLRRLLDRMFPHWEETVTWSRILERSSSELTVIAIVCLLLGLLARITFGWYYRRRLGSSEAAA